MWDTTTGQLISTYNQDVAIQAAAFSPDGKYVAGAGGVRREAIKGKNKVPGLGTVTIWEASTGKEVLHIKGHTNQVDFALFSPDGRYLATRANNADAKTHEVMLWDVSNGRKALDLEFAGTPWRLAFTPDGQHLAVLSEGVVKLWDVVSGQAISTTYAVGGTVMAFSPNGKYLAGASRDKAMVLEIASGQTVLTLQGHTKGVYDVTFSPDGKRLATASADKTVKLWDAVTGQELLTLKGHTNFVYTVVFSPDGKRLASGDIDSALTNTTSTIIIWDASKSMDALDPVKNLY